MWPFRKKRADRDQRQIADIYRGLRNNILSVDPRQLGLTPTPQNSVWGLLMETGYPEAVATLVVIADGTVSLYFSNGGGIIGAGQHETVAESARALLASAPGFLGQMGKTADFPLPKPGDTRFSVLTFDGFFTAEAPEERLGDGGLPLSPLFYRAQDVITQIRLSEKGRGEPVTSGQGTSFEALMRAATTGNTEATIRLLQSGADPNAADESGLTPLMGAAHSGSAGAIRALIEAGARIEFKDASGYTALMFACNAGKLDCAKALIESGADINATDNTRSTPIMFAAQHGHDDLVALLLSKGADPHQKGDHGLSAFGLAQQNGRTKTMALMQRAQ